MSTKLLAIESSCDDTSAAVLDGTTVLSNIISSQQIHAQWGGVIPELASRAHIENISHVVSAALRPTRLTMSDIEAIACTTQPGLVGALLVGTSYAKGLALKYSLPCVPVNHIEGHLYSGFLEKTDLEFPFVALVVSGGHTSLFHIHSFNHYNILGSTRDDAAGEAFDKTAKLLGLSYPGGAELDKLAQTGDNNFAKFPRALMNDDSYEFSFSGIKTSVRNYLTKNYANGFDEKVLSNLCASVQSAIVEVLVVKTMRAAREFDVQSIVIAGGVSANSHLRSSMKEEAAKSGKILIAPRNSYSLDNAAMIGFVAQKKLEERGNEHFRSLEFEVNAKAMRMHRHGSSNY